MNSLQTLCIELEWLSYLLLKAGLFSVKENKSGSNLLCWAVQPLGGHLQLIFRTLDSQICGTEWLHSFSLLDSLPKKMVHWLKSILFRHLY